MAAIDLGLVTAYAYAVSKGYSGTEAQFAQELANIAGMTAQANTLPAGSQATAAYNNGVLSLGIPKGDKGDTGNTGPTGPQGPTGPTGSTGNGISSVTKTGTSGLVDTYTITFTDGTTTTFEVTNGENGTVTPEQMAAAIAAALVDYAKTDGYYIDMSVGNAEQLISDIYETDSVPYQFRTSGGALDIGDREVDEIVGGTVTWNQLIQNANKSKTITNSNTSYTINWLQATTFIANHVYYINIDAKVTTNGKFRVRYPFISSDFTGNLTIVNKALSSDFLTNLAIQTLSTDGNEATFVLDNIQVADLTLALDTVIADYVYNLETATAGAGVAWLKRHFPRMFDQYNAYEPGRIEPVSGVSAHEMTGFNQWDEEWELGAIAGDTGNEYASSTRIRSKGYIAVLPNTSYYFNLPAVFTLCWYDAEKTFVSGIQSASPNFARTSPANAYYARFSVNGTTYNHDICINLHWDGSRDGEYEPYVKHSYDLDPDVTLYGVPYLDENNKLQYNGDIYHSDGTIDRRYGVVDLGTLTWSRYSYTPHPLLYAAISDKYNSGDNGAVCTAYAFGGVATNGSNASYMLTADKSMATSKNTGDPYIYIRDDSYTDAATFKTAMSGVYLVYEKATATTETATPYTNPQIVDDFGTEEYVTDSIVPVGHVTQYQPDLKAKLEMAPDSPEGDGDYIVRQTGGQNAYVPLSSNATIQSMLDRITALENA